MNHQREVSILYRLKRKTTFLLGFLKNLVWGYLGRRRYKGIRSFCLFVGYPRSGHSLVASLLDAHPEVVIGMEWGALNHLRAGYRKNQIYDAIIRNAKAYNARKGNIWTGYSYRVEDSWQGRFREIRVIGDKMGGRTSLQVNEDPGILYRLHRETGLPLKLIHVIRNPFDVIATMTRRNLEMQGRWSDKPESLHLQTFIPLFFDRAKAVRDLKQAGTWPILDVYHEKLIREPGIQITNILDFLGVDYSPEYLLQCASIIYDNPHRSRLLFQWPEQLIRSVLKQMKEYSFLQDYSFDG